MSGNKEPGRSASDSTIDPASRSHSLPLTSNTSASAEALVSQHQSQVSPPIHARGSPQQPSAQKPPNTRFVGFVPLHITTPPIQEGDKNEERLTAERTHSLNEALTDVPAPMSNDRRRTSPPKLGKADSKLSIPEFEDSYMSCSQAAANVARLNSRASEQSAANDPAACSSFSVRRMLSAKAWPAGTPSRQLRNSHSSQRSTKTVLNLSGIRRRYVGHDGHLRKSSICADGLHLDTVNVILKADKDHDGKVTQEEMLQAVSGMVTSNEFFKKLARYLAILVVLLILAISLVVIGTTVGFKDTTVNENNTLIVYSLAGDSVPISTGGLEAVYQVNVAENAFTLLKEPLRQRNRLVSLDFADGSLVQFEPKFVQVFATTALVKNFEVGISLTLRQDELPVVEYINQQPMLYETVAPTGLTSLSTSSPSVAAVRTITLYRTQGQEQWVTIDAQDVQASGGGAVTAVAPKTTAEVQAAAFISLNVALKRGVIPEVDQPLDVRFVLKRRGLLGAAEQWVLFGVDESEVGALCQLVESAEIGGVCGHVGADGQIEVDTTGMSEEELAELCAEETSPSLDTVCGRESASTPYYFSVAATFGFLPVTISADGRNALREWLRTSVHVFNVSAISATVGLSPTSAWDARPHELPHSLHEHFHDSVHRALLGTRAGENHIRRQLEQTDDEEFSRLVSAADEAERLHQSEASSDGLQRRPRRSLLPAYFRNAVANQKEEHGTCFHWDEGHDFYGTRVTTTQSGNQCGNWETFAKAKCPSLQNYNPTTIANCVCDEFNDNLRSTFVALASNYPRAPCEGHRRPMCVVTSGSSWRLENAALPECDSEYFAPVFRRKYSVAATQTPVFDEWLYNLERVVKWGPNYGSFQAYPTFNFCGRGVHLFVFDTGINYLHEDFQVPGSPTRSRVVLSYNAAKKVLCTGSNKRQCLDTAAGRGHGSHVTGIAAGLKYGLAQCAVIHMIKLGENSNFKYTSVQEGIRWAINFHNRNIKGKVNKFGRRLRSVAIASLGVAYSQPYNKQFARLAAAGIPTAVAAGNEDADACRSSPAAIGGTASSGSAASGTAVMTVAATSMDDTKGLYSNYGTCVDVWAPGTAIASVDGVPKPNGQMPTTGYRVMSGTSMAAPLVAGVMALVSEAYPTFSAMQIKEWIKRYARANIITAVPQNLWSAYIMKGLMRPGPLQYFEREWLEQIQTDVCIGGNCQPDDAHNLDGARNLILRLPPRSADGVNFYNNGRRLSEADSGNYSDPDESVESVGACNWTIAIVGSECPAAGSYICGGATGELPDGSSISRPFYQLGPYCADGCYCDPASLPAYFEYVTCVDASSGYTYSDEQCSPVYTMGAAEAYVIEGRSLTWTPLSGGIEFEPPLMETRPVVYELATASAPGDVTIGGTTYSMDQPSRLALYSDASAKVSLFDGDQLFNMFGEDHLAIYVNENGYVCFQDSDVTVASPTIADHFDASKGKCFSLFLTDLTFDTVSNPGSGVYVTTLYTGTSDSRRPYATAITYYQAIGDGDASGVPNTIQAFLEYYSNTTRVVYSSAMSSTIQAVIGPSRGVVPTGFTSSSITDLIP